MGQARAGVGAYREVLGLSLVHRSSLQSPHCNWRASVVPPNDRQSEPVVLEQIRSMTGSDLTHLTHQSVMIDEHDDDDDNDSNSQDNNLIVLCSQHMRINNHLCKNDKITF